jgi:hypothetical protein
MLLSSEMGLVGFSGVVFLTENEDTDLFFQHITSFQDKEVSLKRG